MTELVFFGAANGIARHLATVAGRAGFKGTIVSTTSVEEFAAAAKTSGAALAGPSLFAQERLLADALGLHTRVFRSFGPARIPKPNDLYSNSGYTVVAPCGAATLPEDAADVTLAEQRALSSNKALELAFATFSANVAQHVVAHAARGPHLTLVSQAGLWEAPQETYFKAVRKALAESKIESIKNLVIPIVSPQEIVNSAVLSPNLLWTVALPPLPSTPTILQALSNLSGGQGLASFSWAGEGSTVYHTGKFEDGDGANFVGALIALCELLAKRDPQTADRLYTALQTAGLKGCTYTAAADGKLLDVISAAL